jgi:hypothetical protein
MASTPVYLPCLHNDPLFDEFYHATSRLRVIHPAMSRFKASSAAAKRSIDP